MANENRFIGLTTLSGTEVLEVQEGVGGVAAFAGVNVVRNSRALDLASGSGAATTVMANGQSALMWTGTAPTTWGITLPPSPADGQVVTIGTATTLTTLVTVTAAAGTSLNATYNSQTLSAVTSVQFVYDLPTTTWYRLR